MPGFFHARASGQDAILPHSIGACVKQW